MWERNFRMNMKWATSLLIVCCLVMVVEAAFAKEFVIEEQRIKLPNHGWVVLRVPTLWEVEVRQPEKALPPTIKVSQKEGERFTLLMTPIWEGPKAAKKFNTPKGIQNLVGASATHAAKQAVEPKLIVSSFQENPPGYFFRATDKAPKPGEYPYMTQGARSLGDFGVLTFTILTMEKVSKIGEQAFHLVRQVKHKTASLEQVMIDVAIVKDVCRIEDKPYSVSIQARTFYATVQKESPLYGIHSPRKAYQTFNCHGVKGTMYYYEYRSRADLEGVMPMVQGFIWGKDGPSQQHPELLESVDNVLVIISSHHPEKLKKILHKAYPAAV